MNIEIYMKLFFLFFAVFLFSGCQTVHVTKQYYDEYVNPKAAIDYSNLEETDIPSSFLDTYYAVDSQLVSLKNQIEMAESPSSAQWFETLKNTYPWIKNIGFYDGDGMFLSGSDAFAYDTSIRDLILEQERREGTLLRHDPERVLMLNTIKTKFDAYRVVVLDLDFSALVGGVAGEGLAVAIGDQIVAGEDSIRPGDSIVESLSKDRDYSGSSSSEGRKYLWIRSHAADNLVYFFAK
jgi:hypothetical protein